MAEEGEYCRLLGTRVCPEVYALLPDGYVMQALRHAPLSRSTPKLLFALLSEKVWSQPVRAEYSWRTNLRSSLGVGVPDWALVGSPCATHGDPTMANLMMDDDGRLRLIDPVPPRRVPSLPIVDVAKICMSMAGWEVVVGGEIVLRDDEQWSLPALLDVGGDSVARAVAFWMHVHAARSASHLGDHAGLDYAWCRRVMEGLPLC